ncbi:hypothetical protein MTO96_043791 [Rhipicephalus appendiculatus]
MSESEQAGRVRLSQPFSQWTTRLAPPEVTPCWGPLHNVKCCLWRSTRASARELWQSSWWTSSPTDPLLGRPHLHQQPSRQFHPLAIMRTGSLGKFKPSAMNPSICTSSGLLSSERGNAVLLELTASCSRCCATWLMPSKSCSLVCFNTLWSTGVLPESWLVAVVTPVLKPRKHAISLSSYRPVSLASLPPARRWRGWH